MNPGLQLLEKNLQQLDQSPAESDLKAVERKERSMTFSSHIQLLVCFHRIFNVKDIGTFSETGQTTPSSHFTHMHMQTHTHTQIKFVSTAYMNVLTYHTKEKKGF